MRLPYLPLAAMLATGCAGSELYRAQHVTFVPQTLPGAPVAQGPSPASLKVNTIKQENWDAIQKSALAPLCDLRSAAAKETPAFAPLAKGVATWVERETAFRPPAKPQPAASGPVKVSASVDITIGDEVGVRRIEVACAVGKPLLTVNGLAFPGDVLYGVLGSNSGQKARVALIEVLDRKSGALVGVNLHWYEAPLDRQSPTVPTAQLSAANVGSYIPTNAADPLVHYLFTGDPLDGLWSSTRLENLFVDPGSSPPTGVYIIAPDEKSLSTSSNLSVNRFVVK